MQAFPHVYTVTAAGRPGGDVRLECARLPELRTAAPAEFGGPGDRWSPETLFVGAVADCFILTFRAIANASKLPWISLACEATGQLDRVDRVTRFTGVTLQARLRVPAGVEEAQARRLLVKAEETCLVTRSLNAATHLHADVEIVEQATLQPAAHAD